MNPKTIHEFLMLRIFFQYRIPFIAVEHVGEIELNSVSYQLPVEVHCTNPDVQIKKHKYAKNRKHQENPHNSGFHLIY